MNETFEEFFKKIEDDIHNSDELYDETCRFIKRKLGEWALNKLIPWLNILYVESPKRYRFDFNAIEEYLKDTAYQSDEIGLSEYLKEFWDIALVTIGKEEVKKILKAQTKK